MKNFLKINKKLIKNSQGFTLLEVLLVSFIVSFVFIGIYMTLANTSQHEKDNRYAVIASNLAQEGVEIIRNKRDENLLNFLDIDNSLSGVCYPYWDGSEAKCDGTRQSQMYLDGNNIYRNCLGAGACGGSSSIFKRTCEIKSWGGQSSDECFEVVCEVEWESPSLRITKSIEMNSVLTNWQKHF